MDVLTSDHVLAAISRGKCGGSPRGDASRRPYRSAPDQDGSIRAMPACSMLRWAGSLRKRIIDAGMSRILGFQLLACQESALHGLGHWQRDHDRHVCAIIDGFLADSPDIDPRLIAYANAARRGRVL
jgi:hypothetical protein